jgi:hypothetical protein
MLSSSSKGLRKFWMASGSTCLSRLEVGSNVMSWSRNWPRNVIPAVSAGLFGLLTFKAGSVIRSRARFGLAPMSISSAASMMPPFSPSTLRVFLIAAVSLANGGSVGNRRPNLPCS